MTLRLDTLPTHVLVQLCMVMGAKDLAALEAVARHFWRNGAGGGAQLVDGAVDLHVRPGVVGDINYDRSLREGDRDSRAQGGEECVDIVRAN